MQFVEEEREPGVFVSTGSLLLDLIISHRKTYWGGIPSRRIIEFSGTGGAGKTYINLHILGNAKSKGFDLHVDDIEGRWDLDRLALFNLEKKDFASYNSSQTVEQCFDRIMNTSLKSSAGRLLFVVDPLAALRADKDLDAEASDKMGQARAKALQKKFREMKDHISNIAKKETIVVLSNQLIDNPGAAPFQKKTSIPGGNSVKHWPSIRAELNMLEKLYSSKGTAKQKVTGFITRALITKNSEDDPLNSVDYLLRFGYGIDNIESCLRFLIKVTSNSTGTNSAIMEENVFTFAGAEIGKKGGVLKLVKYIEAQKKERALYELTVDEFRKFHKHVKRKKQVSWE